MRKNISLLLALLLTVSVLLPGCTVVGKLPQTPAATQIPADTGTPATSGSVTGSTEPVEPATAPTEPAGPPPTPSEDALIRWQNAGYRDYLDDAPLEMVPFSEMAYERPDVESLYAEFDALIAKADTTDAETLLEEYYTVYDRYISFYSMDTLANIRHCLDITDDYFNTEYDFCEAETPTVEEKMEALNKAFAACPARYELEELYFGADYFVQFDDYSVYTNPEYLALAQEEESVMSEYRALQADPTVMFQGEEQPFWELLDTVDDYYDYIDLLEAYYDKYNPLMGEVYIRLVKIRKQMAQVLGYDSYADYCYENTYGRDYTPEQGRAFLDGIETYMVPVSQLANADPGLSMLQHSNGVSQDQMEAFVRSGAEKIGGTVLDAYTFMETYELRDVGKAAEKMDSSFQTYIYDYEAPFVFVNAEGSSRDYTTFAHEFGHFTDSYYNYGADEDLETAETFSQSMEFLMLTYSDQLTESQRTRFIRLQLADLIQTFTSQAAFARFEDEVFALPDEELTVDRLNELFLQCCRDYNLAEEGFDFYYSQYWIDVVHFFEVPYYVISYCVSAETALQVYRLEDETPGAGISAYFALLDREPGAGVQQVMEDAGLENPFRPESLEDTADFIAEKLGLDE